MPPLFAEPRTEVEAGAVRLVSGDGTVFAAYSARPLRGSGVGVVVLPDNKGLSGFYERLAVRLAEQGHAAVAVDYYARTAGVDPAERGAGFGDMATLMPHLLKLTPEGLYGDIAAGIAYLRTPEGGAAEAVVALGFCMGGRFAFLTAAERFGLSGVVGLYGFPGELHGAPGPTQRAGELSAPILGLFGGGDENIPAAVVAEFDRALTHAGVPHEFVTYPGAPHGFFDLQLPQFADASADAWARIGAFLDERAVRPTGSMPSR
ncbi:dienelactone hydrolase family protein [Thermocatellispora tengchongensis]|uniref:dienelactone hydrolase family protein n=1 Tax=Thermocatellispora tengchongensis TaxID=1073253 RepID=UPI00363925FC